MDYTVFSAHTIGESHKKEGMNCEDYSKHYSDPEGRFAIAVICDGHSDAKCFRSAVGAKLGCDSITQVMCAWMESFLKEEYPDPMFVLRSKEKEILQRIRMAFVQTWNYKVMEHLKSHPITSEELKKLDTPANRTTMQFYSEGKYLQHIYGATMLAVVGCDDFHIAMQIGDGVIIKVEKGGFYSVPVEDDDKDADAEGPESMCDSDLLSREKAFRIAVYPGCPQALFVTSDGIGDMAYSYLLWETVHVFQKGLIEKQGNSELYPGLMELNAEQESLLKDFVEHFAINGTNADDCSFSGFYNRQIPVSEVRLSEEELQKLYKIMNTEYQIREERFKKSQAHLESNFQKVQYQIDNLEKEISNLRKKEAELEAKLNIVKNEKDHCQTMMEKNAQNFEDDTRKHQEKQDFLKKHYDTGTAIQTENDETPIKQSEEEHFTKTALSDPANESNTPIIAHVPKRLNEKDPKDLHHPEETFTEANMHASSETNESKVTETKSGETTRCNI